MKMTISNSKALNLFQKEFLSKLKKMIRSAKIKVLMKRTMRGNLRRMTWISILRTLEIVMRRKMNWEVIKGIDKICFMRSKEFQKQIDTKRLKWMTMRLKSSKTMMMIQRIKGLSGCLIRLKSKKMRKK